MKYEEQYTEKELIEAGRKALAQHRAEIIDACYRARIIDSYVDVPFRTSDLEKKLAGFYDTLQRKGK